MSRRAMAKQALWAKRPQNPALETGQNARFAGDLAAQLSRSAPCAAGANHSAELNFFETTLRIFR